MTWIALDIPACTVLKIQSIILIFIILCNLLYYGVISRTRQFLQISECIGFDVHFNNIPSFLVFRESLRCSARLIFAEQSDDRFTLPLMSYDTKYTSQCMCLQQSKRFLSISHVDLWWVYFCFNPFWTESALSHPLPGINCPFPE